MCYGSLILKLEFAHADQDIENLRKYSNILIMFFLETLKLDKNVSVLLLNRITETVSNQITFINNKITEKLN